MAGDFPPPSDTRNTELTEDLSDFKAWLEEYAHNGSNIMLDDKYSQVQLFLKTDSQKGAKGQIGDAKFRHFVRKKKYQLINSPERNLVDTVFTVDEQGNLRQAVPLSQIASVLYQTHVVETNHGGIRKTHRALSDKYDGIPEKVVRQFLLMCSHCTGQQDMADQQQDSEIHGFAGQRAVQMHRGPRPRDRPRQVHIKHVRALPNPWAHLQLNLISMEHSPDSQLRFIIHLRDIGSGFSVLSPVAAMDASQCAHQLLSWLSILGPPVTIQAGDGVDTAFVASVVNSLKDMWPAVRVRCQARKPLPMVSRHVTDNWQSCGHKDYHRHHGSHHFGGGGRGRGGRHHFCCRGGGRGWMFRGGRCQPWMGSREGQSEEGGRESRSDGEGSENGDNNHNADEVVNSGSDGSKGVGEGEGPSTVWMESSQLLKDFVSCCGANGDHKWAHKLHILQWKMNTFLHPTTGTVPYSELFGRRPRLEQESGTQQDSSQADGSPVDADEYGEVGSELDAGADQLSSLRRMYSSEEADKSARQDEQRKTGLVSTRLENLLASVLEGNAGHRAKKQRGDSGSQQGHNIDLREQLLLRQKRDQNELEDADPSKPLAAFEEPTQEQNKTPNEETQQALALEWPVAMAVAATNADMASSSPAPYSSAFATAATPFSSSATPFGGSIAGTMAPYHQQAQQQHQPQANDNDWANYPYAIIPGAVGLADVPFLSAVDVSWLGNDYGYNRTAATVAVGVTGGGELPVATVGADVGTGNVNYQEANVREGNDGGLKAFMDYAGLSQFYNVLKDDWVDVSELSEMSESDVMQIGLPIGACKKLMRALRRWNLTLQIRATV